MVTVRSCMSKDKRDLVCCFPFWCLSLWCGFRLRNKPKCITTLRAKLSGVVCVLLSVLSVCLFATGARVGVVCLWLCGSVTTITQIACIDLHQTWSVDYGSHHLQLIKIWLSCASVKGVCSGAKMFGSALSQPARSVGVSPSDFFIILINVWA